jgi:hypothetical protein
MKSWQFIAFIVLTGLQEKVETPEAWGNENEVLKTNNLSQ